jgi:cupin 2 domain-containing protein
VRAVSNLFVLPLPLPAGEWSETLAAGAEVRIERIVSTGQASPPGFYYDQESDEWVALLQGRARLAWEDGRTRDLGPGDCVLLPAHERHRVAWTSSEPPAIWLAVHARLRGSTGAG